MTLDYRMWLRAAMEVTSLRRVSYRVRYSTSTSPLHPAKQHGISTR